MIHFTCDMCGKEIQAESDQRYVVKMEVTSCSTKQPLTEADLDQDSLQAVSELLQSQSITGMNEEVPARQTMRFDLCSQCRLKFVNDPLGIESPHFDFSAN